MKRIAFIATLALIVVATSCKTKQVAEAPQKTNIWAGSYVENLPQEKRLFNKMIYSYAEWNDFVAKGSISFGNMSSDFEMRMVRNEGIQISVRPALGIEAVRIIITPDEVIAYEKMGRRYISGSMETLKKQLPFDVTLEDLQNIFLGRPFIIGSGNITASDYKNFNIEIDGEEWTMTPVKQYDNINYNFELNGAQLITSVASEANSNSEIRCNYSNIRDISNTLTPTKINVSFVNKSENTSCTIYYESVKWNNGTSIEKISTKRYTRISVNDLEKLLR